MSKNYKMTPFAKFFIFLIIAVPLAFIGASYYNGQDPFKVIKEMEIFKQKEIRVQEKSDINKVNSNSIDKELELKNMEIQQLSEKVLKLEEIIEVQKKEIENLKSKTKK